MSWNIFTDEELNMKCNYALAYSHIYMNESSSWKHPVNVKAAKDT